MIFLQEDVLSNASAYFKQNYVDFTQNEGKIYAITKTRLYCFKNKILLFSLPLLSNECNKMCVLDKIFVFTNDKSIYVYSKLGKLEGLITVGEHICDAVLGFGCLFVASYHDNAIYKLLDKKICKKIFLAYTPDKILFYNNCVYCLAHEEFYSHIILFDENLVLKKELVCFRGTEGFCIYKNIILFNSAKYRYKIYPNLKIKSIKKHRQKPV